MKKLAIAAATLVAALATAKGPQDPVAALNQACPGLKQHASDLTVAQPVRQAASLDQQRDAGWAEVHQVLVRVADQPKDGRVKLDYKATGQRCYFDVALDFSKVAVVKRPCVALCTASNFDSSTPMAVYIPVP